MTKKKFRRRLIKLNTSFWRIGAYFFIYSFIGYLIETSFALLYGGTWECRQSFLYGPFCGIYGLGAVALILVLKGKLSKNNYTLFAGGCVVGSLTEYLISMFGEFLLGVKWWDYSDKFLNINGRVCLIYAFFWGILSIFLIRWLNPRVDKFLNFILKRVGVNISKWMVTAGMAFLVVDALVSSLAINYFQLRVVVENDLNVDKKEMAVEYYNEIYVKNKDLSGFIDKYWNNEFMILTYPNLTINLSNGDVLLIRSLYPDIKPYYYKFDAEKYKRATGVDSNYIYVTKECVWTSLS